ncbi:nitrite reductase (NADH) large subunit [Paenibacillus phyllosphaerae]|uniref:Nitrite reductase (NADH) large subunit n=1 Tax=Paenibacillus phyllosphaerae TaxID=274593 RepID=A0A7W5B0S8_9BACL|nr:nitrite reductase large subunit NirB [Paenibacillus phyllosphaerae]MBB3112268.1 nitrite reductase (NADH) large subunit [Paenibacillus phyllosphaerae]
MGKTKLVVIGNGMAGVRCVEEILKLAQDEFAVTIFGGEPHPNYNRIMLSKVLQGDTQLSDITINDWQWYKDNGIALYAGDPVVQVDIERKRVISASGVVAPYDKLIFATGSLPFMLPLPGADLPGVTAFRDIKDCNTMLEASKTYRKAAVIGGGLLGLEAARGLLNLGMQVDVIHINEFLMERQLDREAAIMLRRELEQQGMNFLLTKNTEKILGKKRAEGILFKDGTKINVDLVVIAVGVRPNVKLAAASGIEIDRAILVDDYMRTNVPDVYAVGECAEHRGMVYGMVSPLYEQGKVLAKQICGQETEGYEGSILASHLKVSGVDVFSAGEIRDSETDTSYKVSNGIKGTYKRVFVKRNKVVGAVLFGDSAEGGKLLGYIKQQSDASVLEQDTAQPAGGDAEEAAICAMGDKDTICSCNGVSKGAIVSAIRENGLETFEQVRSCTKASSSCGGCKPLVSALLAYTLANEEEPEPPKVTVCGCTTLSHAELRAAIVAGRYGDVQAVRSAHDWKSGEGCSVCQSAIAYYLGVAAALNQAKTKQEGAWTAAVRETAAAEAEGTQAAGAGLAFSQLADGTYSIMPRMYGGVTSGDQLRRIAEVVDRFAIPQVKLTSGGGLDLRGIAAEQLAEVGAALAMPVAAASYGKPIGAVITCGGSQYESGAWRDSVALGARLERLLEGAALPAEFTAAVSGSTLHRAGTLTADLGLVGTPAGWEIYAGGSRTKELRAPQLIGVCPSDEEAIAVAAAFVAWYREEAEYGELSWQWMERVGLIPLREGLFDGDVRERFMANLPSDGNVLPSSPAVGYVHMQDSVVSSL